MFRADEDPTAELRIILEFFIRVSKKEKVMSKVSEEFQPPVVLSEASKILWSQLVPRRARSPERLELLTQALHARDRAEELRQVLAAEGLFVVTERSGVKHPHPAAGLLAEAERTFSKLWLALKFEFWPAIDRG